MVLLDYIVLAVYFMVLVAIGFAASRKIKRQEDYFMGGRSFGKKVMNVHKNGQVTF